MHAAVVCFRGGWCVSRKRNGTKDGVDPIIKIDQLDQLGKSPRATEESSSVGSRVVDESELKSRIIVFVDFEPRDSIT